MTFLKQLKPEQKAQIQDLLSQDIELHERMIESLEDLKKHLRGQIAFYVEVLKNRQTIENLRIRLEMHRRQMEHAQV